MMPPALRLGSALSLAAMLLACASSEPVLENRTFVGGGDAPTSGEMRAPRTAAPNTAAAAECSHDDDCVPATCCHSTWCAPAAQGPACEGVGCTAVELPQTLDGAAVEGIGCLCVEGRCGARLNDGCVVTGPQPPAQEASEHDPAPTCPPTRPPGT